MLYYLDISAHTGTAYTGIVPLGKLLVFFFFYWKHCWVYHAVDGFCREMNVAFLATNLLFAIPRLVSTWRLLCLLQNSHPATHYFYRLLKRIKATAKDYQIWSRLDFISWLLDCLRCFNSLLCKIDMILSTLLVQILSDKIYQHYCHPSNSVLN